MNGRLEIRSSMLLILFNINPTIDGKHKNFLSTRNGHLLVFYCYKPIKRKAKALKESRYKLNPGGSSEANKIDKLQMAGKQNKVPALNDRCGSEITKSIKMSVIWPGVQFNYEHWRSDVHKRNNKRRLTLTYKISHWTNRVRESFQRVSLKFPIIGMISL